jgi:hypothetical protein
MREVLFLTQSKGTSLSLKGSKRPFICWVSHSLLPLDHTPFVQMSMTMDKNTQHCFLGGEKRTNL